MVHIPALWIPLLLSSVLVFIVSAIIHMVLGYHRSDYKKLPSEDAVLEALRKFNIPPGDYHFPRPDSMKAMKDPAFIEKCTKGPIGMMSFDNIGPISIKMISNEINKQLQNTLLSSPDRSDNALFLSRKPMFAAVDAA